MTEAIGPGSPVIFKGVADRYDDDSGLTLGALYFVERVARCFRACPACGERDVLGLRGSPGRWLLYCGCAFTPLGGDAAKEAAKQHEHVPA